MEKLVTDAEIVQPLFTLASNKSTDDHEFSRYMCDMEPQFHDVAFVRYFISSLQIRYDQSNGMGSVMFL